MPTICKHKQDIYYKKILITAIALLAMANCAVVDKRMTAGKYGQTQESGNITEKPVSLINRKTKTLADEESAAEGNAQKRK